MAIYQVQAPDGAILRVEGPDGATDQEVIAHAQRMYKPEAVAAPAAPSPFGPAMTAPSVAGAPSAPPAPHTPGFMHGLKYGLQQLPESAKGTVDAVGYATGLKTGSGLPVSQPLPPDPGMLSPTFTGFGDAYSSGDNFGDSLGNLFTQAKEVSGQSIAQFLPSIALGTAGTIGGGAVAGPPGAVVGGTAGAFAGSYAQAPAEIFSSLQEAAYEFNNQPGLAEEDKFTNQDIAKFSLELGVPIAAMDAIPSGKSARKIGGSIAKEVAPEITKEGMMQFLKSRAKTAPKEIAKTAVTEGTTEGAQQATQIAGVDSFVGKNPITTENAKEVGEAILSGVVGGTTLGAGTEATTTGIGAIKRTVQSKLPQAPQRPSQDTQQPAAEQASTEPVTPPPVPQPKPATDWPSVAPATPVAPPPVDPPAPTAQPGGTSTPATPVEPPVAAAPSKRKKVVTPDGGMEIETEDEVVELDSLVRASGDLQPRDRSRATSDLQIQKIATELDPERLGDSRTTETGAPIIGPDSTIESGNGRTTAIRRAYEANSEAAARYRQSLVARGFNIEGIKNPILVRRRKTELTPEERVRFTALSNKDSIAAMSSTEKARADATQMDDDLVDLHKGGEPDSVDNQDFIQAFIRKITTGNESSALIGPDKQLNQEGIKRAKAALVAKAYNDPDLVENIFESADSEVKSIGNVLRDRAPEYAQLGAAVRRGDVPARFDITKQLMEAVALIRNAKKDGKSIRDIIEGTKQTSMIEEETRDPMVEKIVRSLYRPGLGRMLAQSQIDSILKQYAVTAKEQRANDLFGENKTQPIDLLDAAYEKVAAELEAKANGQGAFLESSGDTGSVEEKPAAPVAGKQSPAKPVADADQLQSRVGKNRPSEADPEELAKTGGRRFEQFAKSKGTSPYRTAYVDLGLDPDIATSKPAEEQLKILSDAMSDRFGMKIEISNKLDRRAALDMLHNIYNNLSFLSATIGLPYKAIGLNGTLGVTLQDKLRGALGAYYPAEKRIRLPNKTNSFIHEWLHALDDHLLNKFGNVSEGDLFSGIVRKDGTINPHDGVQAAFANLLHAIFYDKAMMASIKLDLEAKLARAKTEASKADLQRKLKELEAGNYKGIKGKTNYYTSSRDFGNGNTYWTSPEEMLARVFEAYSAYKIENAGGDPSSIAKGDMAYLSNVDERLAKTFPKLEERQVIFDAVDQFISRLRESEMLGKDIDRSKPMALDDMSILDSSDWAYMPRNAKTQGGLKAFIKGMISEQKAEIDQWRASVVRLKEMTLENKKIKEENPASAISSVGWLLRSVFTVDRSVLHSLEKRHTSAALKQLNDRIFTRPGQGQVVKQDYFFTTRNVTAQYKKRLGNFMRMHGVARSTKATAADNKLIRDILIGKAQEAPAEIKKVAGGLRKLLDDMYEELKDAGVEISYLQNQGYLSRLYITRKILADKEKFLEKASEVYGLQFDQKAGEIIDDIIEDPSQFIQYLKKMLHKNADKLSITKKEAKELLDALSAEEGLSDDMKARLESIIDDVRTFYSETAANDWLHRIQYGPSDILENGSPSSGFTKKRALPPETDTLLEDFMETDPFVIVDHYADLVGRRVGLQNVLNPKGKISYKQLIEEMKNDGMPNGDIKIIEKIYDKLLGVNSSEHPIIEQIKPFFSIVHLGGMLSMLDLAAFSSLAERFTAVVKTKRVSDLFRTVIYSMDQIAGTQSAKDAREAAESVGIIMNELAAAALDARMGGFKEIDIVEKISAQFFIRNGLTMLDNSNRLVAFRISKGYFEHLARRLLSDNTKAQDKDLITREMAEYGISPEDVVAFARWLTGDVKDGSSNGLFNGFADVKALRESPFGMDFILALNRFNDQTIQRPTAADRPYASKNPIGSLVFAVTSFAFAFYENMVKSEAKKVGYVWKEYGKLQGARQASLMALSWAPLLAATMITNALRVALFDSEHWEELKKKDDVMEYLTLRSLSAMGIFGPVVDHFINVATGVRYQRDIATSFSGAYLSNYAQWFQSVIGASNVTVLLGKEATNSPNTNTQEYNVIKNTWKTIIAPSISAGLSLLPGGKPFSIMSGIGIAGIGSSTLADDVAESVVGPNGEKKGGSTTGEPKEPKAPKEPKEPK